MPLKKPLLVILYLLLPFFVLSQTYQQYDLKKMVPTSPEAAILGRHGDIPVSHYNGTTDVSVPLYSISENGVEIPIILRYHSSGIKVSDEASMVGLGWSLEPSGSIIQVVNGEIDTYDNLFDTSALGYKTLRSQSSNSVYYERPLINNYFLCYTGYTTYVEDPETVNKIVNGMGQPDIYQFSFPGYSGKFYIHPELDTIIVLNPTVKLKIEKWGLNGWSVTTIDGNKFYFSTFEYSESDNSSGKKTAQTWKLGRIEFSNQKLITFDYNSGFYRSYSYSETYHAPYPWNMDSDNFKKNASLNSHYVQYLSKINSDEIKIKFNYEDRIDVLSVPDNDGNAENGVVSSKRLKSLDILNRDSIKVKSFKFNYSYFIADTIGGSSNSPIPPTSQDAYTKRLRLDSVQEIGYNKEGLAVYNPATYFMYDSIPLPAKTSFAVDFWGYYNGKHNVRLLPSIDYYKFDNSSIYDSLPSMESFTNLNGANKTPDSLKMQAGMLKRIKYPTGGHTEFKYEVHDFNNFTYTDIDAIRNSKVFYVAEDKNVSNIPNTITFTIPKTTTIRVTNTINRGPNQSLTFNDFLPCKIYLMKMNQGSYTFLKEWQMVSNQQYSTDFNQDGMVQWVEDVTINYDPNPNVVYIMGASLPDVLGPQNTSNNSASVKSYFEFYNINTDSARISFGGGLRIKEVKSYSESGTLALQKKYIYKDSSNTTTGKLMSPLVNLYSRKVHAVDAPPAPAPVAHMFFNTWNMVAENAIPFSSYGNGVVVGYSVVDEINCNSKDEQCGIRRLEYLNTPNLYKINTPDVPDAFAGKLQRELIFVGAEPTPIKEVRYSYKELTYSFFSGVKAFSNLLGPNPCSIPGFVQDFPIPDPFHPLTMYSICFYPIRMSWMVTDKVTTKEFYSSGFITNLEEYQHNGFGQIVNSKTINSEGKIQEVISKYPVDVEPLPGSVIEEMINQNLLSKKLEEVVKVDGAETIRTKINYINPFQIVEGSIEYSLKGGDFFNEVSFQSYGNSKTIRQLEKSGMKTSFIWGLHNTKVIAMVVNATWDAIGYSSFESADKGGLQYTGSIVSDISAPTGSSCYNLSTGNISHGTMSSAFVYIFSYWSKNGMYSVSNSISSYTGKTINGWTFYSHKVTGGGAGYTISGSGLIDEVRFYPEDAQMTSYTYLPILGMSTLTDDNGKIFRYSYDSFGRLTNIRDDDDNVVKRICYNYAGQTEDCGNEPVYYNEPKFQTFTRNNCGTGFTGSAVVYAVAANTYRAASLEAANALAQEDIDNNGQTYANNNGTCTESVATIYVRVEMDDLYEYTEGENGPWAYYDQLEHHVNLYLRFYSDAACTTPYVLNDAITYTLNNYYTVHDQIGTVLNSGNYDLGALTITPHASSLYLGQPGYIFYKRLEYDENNPAIILYESLESNTFTITTSGSGTSFTPVATKYNFTRHPQYYYND